VLPERSFQTQLTSGELPVTELSTEPLWMLWDGTWAHGPPGEGPRAHASTDAAELPAERLRHQAVRRCRYGNTLLLSQRVQALQLGITQHHGHAIPTRVRRRTLTRALRPTRSGSPATPSSLLLCLLGFSSLLGRHTHPTLVMAGATRLQRTPAADTLKVMTPKQVDFSAPTRVRPIGTSSRTHVHGRLERPQHRAIVSEDRG
jgi:hypothetical protein